MSADPTLHSVTMQVCSLCLDGAGGECHVPGCVFWMHDAPTPADRGATLRQLLVGVGSIDGVTTFPVVPDAAGSRGEAAP